MQFVQSVVKPTRTLTLQNRQCTLPVNIRLLRRIARALLQDLLQIEDFNLGVYLVSSPEITRLNESFVRHKGSTDVITFDYSAASPTANRNPPLNRNRRSPSLHAEIFICLDEAVAQARRFRTTWQSELLRYLIHGLLHLQGHDDQRAASRLKMKREEDRLLRELVGRFELDSLAQVTGNQGDVKSDA